jgi:hypothetical protein
MVVNLSRAPIQELVHRAGLPDSQLAVRSKPIEGLQDHTLIEAIGICLENSRNLVGCVYALL